MTLWAAVNVYRDAWTLRRCLRSIRSAAPHARIVVVDGAYERFPHPAETAASLDGTLAIAGEHADEIVRCGREAWPDECAKRSAYLIGKDGDFYLVVDADEELVGEVPRRLCVPDRDVMIESAATPPQHGPYPIFRMFRHRGPAGAMKYRGAHSAIWAGDVLLNERPRQVATEFRLRHWNFERDARRMIEKGAYYDRMCAEERPFRESHVMI